MRAARDIMVDLAGTGLSAEQTALMLELMAAVALDARPAVDAQAERRREKDRERKREIRLRKSAESADDADIPPTPDKSPPHPQKLTPTPGEHTRETRTRGNRAFPCPESVNPQHWADFLANRNRKRLANTPTAYRAQLAKLDELSDDEWPPDRIVQFAAARGWGAFFDPRGRDDERRNGHHGMAGDHRASSGLGTTVDAALDFIADVRGQPRH